LSVFLSVSNAWHDIIKCNKISLELTQHNGQVAFFIAIEPSLTSTSSSRLIFGYTLLHLIMSCHALLTERNTLHYKIVDVLPVQTSVDIFNLEESDILLVMRFHLPLE
jgi:hypothetical protein